MPGVDCCQRWTRKQTNLGPANFTLQDQKNTGISISPTGKWTHRTGTSGYCQHDRQILQQFQQAGLAEASSSRTMGGQNNSMKVNTTSGIRIGLQSGLSTSYRLFIGILEHHALGR